MSLPFLLWGSSTKDKADSRLDLQGCMVRKVTRMCRSIDEGMPEAVRTSSEHRRYPSVAGPARDPDPMTIH